ncbi:hypothetical protein [Sorangium sp. So ce145]|uniref:hypothetical protein n=1 Tax=Sorangium sp. So ce145 TaxID=3133285 RepID=UPI003F622DF1
MGARDDDDIRKYMPDLKTIARTADPALAEERYREAINNPELDRALDDLRQGNGAGQAPFEFPVVVAAPKPAETPAPAPAAPGSAAPVAPVAAAKVAGGQTGAGPARDAAPPRDRRRGMSRGRIAVLLTVVVLGPLATYQVFSRLRRAEAPVASAAPVAPSGAMTAPGRPSAEAAGAGASTGAPAAAEPGTRPGAPPAVDAGASDEVSPPAAGASDEAPPPKAGASDEAPPPKAGASDEAPPPKAGASARPAVPAPRAPAGARPPPAEVSPAPPEIAADIMH